MWAKFMPYQPAISERGRQRVVTTVSTFMIRFCPMSIWAWYSLAIWLAYSRSIWLSARRLSTRRPKWPMRWALSGPRRSPAFSKRVSARSFS